MIDHDTDNRQGDRRVHHQGWDEQPYAEHERAPKLTHARVTSAYGGNLEGQGTAGPLMLYDDDDATYAGQGEAEMAYELRWSLE